MRPYEASTRALLQPDIADTVFRSNGSPQPIPLAVEAARLAYIRTEESAAAKARLGEALGLVGFKNVMTFDNPGTDGQGYGAVREGQVLLAFRGTQSDRPTDILTDAQTTLRRWPLPAGLVHKGFARTAQSLWDEDVGPWLSGLPKGLALTLCGHSLGAAIATLLAGMAHDLLQASATQLVTIGSPRVGDREFVSGLQQKVRIARIVNCCDLVTEIPPAMPPVLPVVHAGEPPTYIDRHGALASFSIHADDRAEARADYLLNHAAWFGNLPVRDLSDHAPANYLRAFYD